MLDKATADAIRYTLWKECPKEYFADCLHIKDKISGRIVPFRMNRAQQAIYDMIMLMKRQKRPVRLKVLKYRQGGMSTLAAAFLFHSCRFSPDLNVIVSLDLESAEHIFGIISRFYHYLPKYEQKRLPTDASNRKEIKFSEPHGGRILIDTAGKTSAGHSYTIRGLHLTEVSRWPDGTEDARAGLLNSVPDTPDSVIIVESVANGMSGWFYDEWHKKDDSYERVFVPWFWQDEYKTRLPMPEVQYRTTLADSEHQLIARYQLSLEQIEWRRITIRNKLDGSEKKFREQYPSNEKEAFISSGHNFFDVEFLDKVETSKPMRGELRVVEDLAGRPAVRFFENPNGWLRVWQKPRAASQYVIGADVAEGIEVDGAPEDDKYDYSCADVLDRNTGQQAAQLHGHITPDELGRQIALLGEWYNHAFVGVESNAGYGLHVIETMRSAKYPDHLFYREEVIDETTKRPTKKLGWRTSVKTRTNMMSALDRDHRAGDLHIYSAETIAEMRSFVKKPDGRIEAGAGRKDDRVFSLAIAARMLAAAPMASPVAPSANHPVVQKWHPAKNLLERYARA